MPSPATMSTRPNLHLPEIKPRQVSSNSSLDSGNSLGASTAASSINYAQAQYSNSHNNEMSNNNNSSLNSGSLMNSQSMSMLSMSMDDPINTLMADVPISLEQTQQNVYQNNLTGHGASTQQLSNHPAALTSSVDYSTNIDSINFLPLVTSGNQGQTQTLAPPSQNQYSSTIMPIAPPQPTQPISTNTISDEAVAQIVSNTSVPEFLYQLTKMLTDDHRDIIEWSNAKIEVHNPHRLESEVLNKYFRHSKYASFQRQLNYFGFRKLAGKGKMAPCSYVNENATTDLRSLLRMKRKTSATTKDAKEKNNHDNTDKKKSSQNGRISGSKSQGVKRSRAGASAGPVAKIAVGKGVRHQLNGYLRNVTPNTVQSMIVPSNNQLETDPTSLARSAVGKGVAHQFTLNNTTTAETSAPTSNLIESNHLDGFRQHGTNGNNFTFLDPSQLGMGIDNNLSELQNNYQSSLNDTAASSFNGAEIGNGGGTVQKSSLRRDSSLVALAMIPSLQSIEPTPVAELEAVDDKHIMSFIDFPSTGDDQVGLNVDAPDTVRSNQQ